VLKQYLLLSNKSINLFYFLGCIAPVSDIYQRMTEKGKMAVIKVSSFSLSLSFL